MVVKKSFNIVNENGVHARPSASFVKIANKYSSDIFVEHDGCEVNGKSIIGLLTLAAGRGSLIRITANGNDAKEAIESLGKLVEAGFNE